MAKPRWVRGASPWFMHRDDRTPDLAVGLRYRFVRDDYAGECPDCVAGDCVQQLMRSDEWDGIVTGHMGSDLSHWN